jgi:hypothetical protein
MAGDFASKRVRLMQPSGLSGRAVTAQGHPRTIFKRAIERSNVLVEEATGRMEPAKLERPAMR